MALNKSLEYDLDLPSTLAGVESLLAAGMQNSGGGARINGILDSSLPGFGSLGLGTLPNTASMIPDSAPAQVPGLTMGELRAQLEKLTVPGADLNQIKEFLKNYGLLPYKSTQEPSPGALESMKSIEVELPAYEENAMSETGD